MDRAGARPGAGQQGTWQDKEGSEPVRLILAVLAKLGQFMPLSHKCCWTMTLV